MCEKGYQQSHMLDYYLGDGMTDPPKPNIKYPDGSGRRRGRRRTRELQARAAAGPRGLQHRRSSETLGRRRSGQPETGGNTVADTGGAVANAGRLGGPQRW